MRVRSFGVTPWSKSVDARWAIAQPAHHLNGYAWRRQRARPRKAHASMQPVARMGIELVAGTQHPCNQKYRQSGLVTASHPTLRIV
jgi:hypothetical protein